MPEWYNALEKIMKDSYSTFPLKNFFFAKIVPSTQKMKNEVQIFGKKGYLSFTKPGQ